MMLVTAVLILCILGVVLLGFAIVSKIDKFFDNINMEENRNEDVKNEVLIYPAEGIPNGLGPLLHTEGITYLIIAKPYIPENTEFKTLIALSDCDLDNLLLCGEARHNYPGSFIIARCNDLLYLNIFENIGINHVLTGTLSASELLFALKGVSYND